MPSSKGDPDPDGFWALSASEVDADVALAELIEALPEQQLAGNDRSSCR